MRTKTVLLSFFVLICCKNSSAQKRIEMKPWKYNFNFELSSRASGISYYFRLKQENLRLGFGYYRTFADTVTFSSGASRNYITRPNGGTNYFLHSFPLLLSFDKQIGETPFFWQTELGYHFFGSNLYKINHYSHAKTQIALVSNKIQVGIGGRISLIRAEMLSFNYPLTLNLTIGYNFK